MYLGGHSLATVKAVYKRGLIELDALNLCSPLEELWNGPARLTAEGELWATPVTEPVVKAVKTVKLKPVKPELTKELLKQLLRDNLEVDVDVFTSTDDYGCTSVETNVVVKFDDEVIYGEER